MVRTASALQVAGRRDGDDLQVGQLPDDERRRRWLSEAHRNVDPIADEIADLLAGDAVEFELRIELQKLAEPAG